MDTSFDNSALTYDETFTNSNIGRYLRQHVHEYLNLNLPKDRKLRILELNCGTGEDAILLAKKGNFVTASDASVNMLEVAKNKVSKLNEYLQINFKQIDITGIDKFPFIEKFDLIF
jgi:ubiquinone/menaquinone biosynthesis C-methylase UbiE